jgi:hypothetical protein
MGDFFKLAGIGHVENIVTTIMQIITGFTHGTQRYYPQSRLTRQRISLV